MRKRRAHRCDARRSPIAMRKANPAALGSGRSRRWVEVLIAAATVANEHERAADCERLAVASRTRRRIEDPAPHPDPLDAGSSPGSASLTVGCDSPRSQLTAAFFSRRTIPEGRSARFGRPAVHRGCSDLRRSVYRVPHGRVAAHSAAADA
jgi:hypothetical protein